MTNDVYVVVLAVVAFLWVFLFVMLSRGKSRSADQDLPGAAEEHDQENAVRLR